PVGERDGVRGARFMGSLHSPLRTHWDHEPRRVRSAGFPACGSGRLSSRPFLVHRTRKSGKPAGWKACATSRFMGSLHDFDAAHWDHEPLTARSPGFSRPKPFEPPKGGTPNQPRFMESHTDFDAAHWDHDPRAGTADLQ